MRIQGNRLHRSGGASEPSMTRTVHPSEGDLACDAGALDALGLDGGIGVGAYFANKAEAEAFSAEYGTGAYPPVRVIPGCAD